MHGNPGRLRSKRTSDTTTDMVKHLTEEHAGLGISLTLRSFVGFDETLHQVLRGTEIAVAGPPRSCSDSRLLTRAANDIARSLKRPPRFLGGRAQFAGDLEAPIGVWAVNHGDPKFRCTPTADHFCAGTSTMLSISRCGKFCV